MRKTFIFTFIFLLSAFFAGCNHERIVEKNLDSSPQAVATPTPERINPDWDPDNDSFERFEKDNPNRKSGLSIVKNFWGNISYFEYEIGENNITIMIPLKGFASGGQGAAINNRTKLTFSGKEVSYKKLKELLPEGSKATMTGRFQRIGEKEGQKNYWLEVDRYCNNYLSFLLGPLFRNHNRSRKCRYLHGKGIGSNIYYWFDRQLPWHYL